MSTNISIEYSEDDERTWSTLFKRQMKILNGKAPSDFFKGVEMLGLVEDKIPDIHVVNQSLFSNTGWKIEPLSGSISGAEYFNLLKNSRSPSTTFMRNKDELNHSPIPDLFHDLFGHVPLLYNKSYAQYLVSLGVLAGSRSNQGGRLMRLGRIYKWTIEFGLCKDSDRLTAYGAGLLSSELELYHSLGDDCEKIDFNPKRALEEKHRPASLQSRYFVVESFEQLRDYFPAIERYLDAR